MKMTSEEIPWERLARYAAGECSKKELAALSARIETEPEVAEALAEVLLLAVVVRDDAEAHPERIRSAVPVIEKRCAWLSPSVLAVAAALVVAFTSVWFFASGSQDRDILNIAALEGAVRWTGRGGEVRDGFKPGESLPGGLLETLSDDGTVTLAFGDNTTITLLRHSTATLSDDGRKRVHLREGYLSADVRPQPTGRPMIIHTPTAAVEVLGTRFDVYSDSSNTRLSVNEGRVRMTRLVDGRVAEVMAAHEVVASLNRAEDFQVTPRRTPEVIWRSDFARGGDGAEGRWLPTDSTRPARLAAEPVFLPKTSRGPVTIHRIAVALPWQELKTVQVRPESRLRITGRSTTAAPLELMLLGRKPEGGHAGHFFREIEVKAGSWQMETTVGDFRKGSANATQAPPTTMNLSHISIYTINTDASLEIDSVEVLRE